MGREQHRSTEGALHRAASVPCRPAEPLLDGARVRSPTAARLTRSGAPRLLAPSPSAADLASVRYGGAHAHTFTRSHRLCIFCVDAMPLMIACRVTTPVACALSVSSLLFQRGLSRTPPRVRVAVR